MNTWRALVAASLAAVAMGPLHAAAQNLLVNGSFEAGLAGWTASAAPCSQASLPAGAPSLGAGAWITPAPADGLNVYMGDTLAPGSCFFFQDVTLPVNVTSGTLSYSAGYNFNDFGGGPAGCSASIDITTTANVPIATGYTQVAAAANDPMVPRPPIAFTTTPGGTVRVLFTEISCAGGPVGLVADNLVLAAASPFAIPTLDDWAKILTALLLAASAMFSLRNRSR